jgi:hypothetical protein
LSNENGPILFQETWVAWWRRCVALFRVAMVYCNLCYQNPSVEIISEENNHSIKSRARIEQGELLLLEHAISSETPAHLVNIVSQNKELWQWLCPRGLVDYGDRNHAIGTTKVSSNAFRANGLYVLGKYTSCMNHRCQPNACVVHTQFHGFLIPITFMAIYALETIMADEEIMIMYSPSVGHSPNEYHDFTCDCSLTEEDRVTISQRIKTITSTPSSLEMSTQFSAHRQLIEAYFTDQPLILPHTHTLSEGGISSVPFVPSDTMKNTVITQTLAMVGGVYKVSEEHLLPLERFLEFIAEHYHVDPSRASDTEKMNCLFRMVAEFEGRYDEWRESLVFTWS